MIDRTAEPPTGRLVDRTRADPTTPLLVTGLASAAILSADAEMRAPRETRGGTVEWGGAYAEGIRLTGPWTIAGGIDGREYDLPSTLEDLEAFRWKVVSTHAWGPVRVRHRVVPMPFGPGVGRTLEFSSPEPKRVRVLQRIQPFLAPVLVEGIKPYVYRITGRGTGLEARAFGWAAVLAPSFPATSWSLDRRPWDGKDYRGELGEVGIVHDLDVTAVPRSLTLLVSGGLASTVDKDQELGTTALVGSRVWPPAAEAAWASWTAGTPTMELPGAPQLARAYDLARSAVRALYTKPTDDITGLVAGYPWYPSLWCRDQAWMLPAVLWLGDRAWAEASIRTVLRFQATSRIPLLGAEVGEIPMQISPGPVFLYGTSDTSLYYPDLTRRLVDHGGPLDTVRDLWPHLRAVADWAKAKIDTTSGLFTNGGEVAELRDATAHFGSVHYGFDAVDTTIWDSTDRRDHAIDAQVHCLRAFRAMGELGSRIGRTDRVADDEGVAQRLADAIATRYTWPAEKYLYDSLGRDGAPLPKLRPNALLAVSAGLLDLDTGRATVVRAGQDDLATAWGLRTLSDRDASYDPTAYHDGQVWTIATAWAAEAAFAVGDAEGGLRWLGTIADRIVEENGLANECYRGDRPEPFDSCFLLGFSVAPFLTVLFERLWGLVVRSDQHALSVRPAFPAGWSGARLHHLAVAGGFVDLDWTPSRIEVRWSGPGPLDVRSGDATLALGHDGAGTLDLRAP